MPHCPRCLEESSRALARCPWDRSFYVVTACAHCQREVFPRERYCGGCGRSLEGRLQAQAPLAPAGRLQRGLALSLDLLAVFVFAPLSWELWSAPAAPVLFTGLYLVGLQSGGRQTLGQLVLRCVVLDERWRSLSMPAAARYVLTLGLGGRSSLWSSPDL